MDDCVVNRVREIFPKAEGPLAAHRLDMETSGLMVLGLTSRAHRHLSGQFEQRLVRKTYIALLEGCVEGEKGHIELAFRVDIDNRPRQILDPVYGKLGITDWEVLERRTTRACVSRRSQGEPTSYASMPLTHRVSGIPSSETGSTATHPWPTGSCCTAPVCRSITLRISAGCTSRYRFLSESS